MKKKLLLFALLLMAFVCLFSVLVSAKDLSVEAIPNDLLHNGDSVTHFVVIEGEEWFVQSNGVITNYNVSALETAIAALAADGGALHALGYTADDIGVKWDTKIILPNTIDGVTITSFSWNTDTIRHSKYSKNCGYFNTGKVQSNSPNVGSAWTFIPELRCFEYDKNTEITAMPADMLAGAKKFKKFINLPLERFETIGSNAFGGNKTILSGVLYLNATTIGDNAFNNALTNVTGIVFGENLTSIGNQTFTVKSSETGLGAPLLEFVEFKCDITTLQFVATNDSSNKGSFYFGGAYSRTAYSNLKCIILSNPANASLITGESAALSDVVTGLRFDSDASNNLVYKSHSIDTSTARIEYPDGYAKSGALLSDCTRCVYKASEKTNPLITALGYSIKIGKNALDGGFEINLSALEAYEKINNTKVNLGILILNPKYLTAESFFDENGNLMATSGAVNVQLEGIEYNRINYMISGFSSELQDVELVICAYMYEDKNDVQIIQKEYAYEKEDDVSPMVSKITKGQQTLYSVTFKSVLAPETTLFKNDLDEYTNK